MMIKVGSSLAWIAPGFFTSLDGLISRSEKFKKLHENPNCIPKLRDILIHVDPLPLGGYDKFFKPKCNGEL
jgi:hypothetical protein